MIVLHVINGLGTGGAERSLAEALPGLAAAGLTNVVAVLHRRDEGVQSSVLELGADVRFLRAGSLPGRVRELRTLLRSVHADVVHTAIFESDVAGRLAAAGTGVPVVTTLVNTSYRPERLAADPNLRRWRLSAARRLDGWTARRLTRRFIAITKAVADAAVMDLGIAADRITVIERGRDGTRLGDATADRRAAARSSLRIDEGAPVVLHVGRHEHQKGIDVLLDAVPSLPVGTVVLQAGRRGNASDVVEARASDQVRLLGHRGDVPDLLCAADVLAFPSRYEGLGGTLLEAMALGTPIVASDIPAIREVAEGVAVLVPPGDAGALAAALGAVLADPGRRAEMGELGRRRFAERFTLERSVTRTAALLHEVGSR